MTCELCPRHMQYSRNPPAGLHQLLKNTFPGTHGQAFREWEPPWDLPFMRFQILHGHSIKESLEGTVESVFVWGWGSDKEDPAHVYLNYQLGGGGARTAKKCCLLLSKLTASPYELYFEDRLWFLGQWNLPSFGSCTKHAACCPSAQFYVYPPWFFFLISTWVFLFHIYPLEECIICFLGAYVGLSLRHILQEEVGGAWHRTFKKSLFVHSMCLPHSKDTRKYLNCWINKWLVQHFVWQTWFSSNTKGFEELVILYWYFGSSV